MAVFPVIDHHQKESTCVKGKFASSFLGWEILGTTRLGVVADRIPSMKLTFSHPKIDGWNTIVSFWEGLGPSFRCELLVSGLGTVFELQNTQKLGEDVLNFYTYIGPVSRWWFQPKISDYSFRPPRTLVQLNICSHMVFLMSTAGIIL